MATSTTQRKGGPLKSAYTSSHYDKRRRNKSYINPHEFYTAIKRRGEVIERAQNRSRSNIDAAEVEAAEELRRLQQTLSRSDTRSRCNSLSSTESASSLRVIGVAPEASISGSPEPSEGGLPVNIDNDHLQSSACLTNDKVIGYGFGDLPAPQLTVAERAALAYASPRRQRKSKHKLVQRQKQQQNLQQQSQSVAGPAVTLEELPPYRVPPKADSPPPTSMTEEPSKRSNPNQQGQLRMRRSKNWPVSKRWAVLHDDEDDVDHGEHDFRTPLRSEETAFEGVSMAHLRQLEFLQLQRQMLLLAEARVKNSLDSPPPFDAEPPPYDMAMTPNEPPPYEMAVSPPPVESGIIHLLPGGEEQTESSRECDLANADSLSHLLEASC